MSPARKPETLASIAGLSIRPGAPDGAVLLVIDGQLEYTVGRLPLDGVDRAVEEAVLIKALPNAFAGTPLAAVIAATGRRQIVIAGFATHMCVGATACSALDHGFRSVVVADATATRDLPHPLGAGVVPAAAVRAATLAALSDRFSVVIQDTVALQCGQPK